MIVIFEEKSAKQYFDGILSKSGLVIDQLSHRIFDAGGITKLDTCLGEIKKGNPEEEVFVIFDGDEFSKFGHKLTNIYKHQSKYKFIFPRDFEDIFPSWMIESAVCRHMEKSDKVRTPLTEKEIDECYRQNRVIMKTGKKLPIHYFLKKYAKSRRISVPNKVALARHLMQISEDAWYWPPKARALLHNFYKWTGVKEMQTIISKQKMSNGFIFNIEALQTWGIRGRLAVTIGEKLWIFNLEEGTACVLIPDHVVGPSSWAADGKRLAFSWKGANKNGSMRIYDEGENSLSEEFDEIGYYGYLCWDRSGKIYGNQFSTYVQVVCLDPTSGERPMPLEKLPIGAIMCCFDRCANEILVGIQGERGHYSEKLLANYKISNRCAERVWDSSNVDLPIADRRGSISPDGKMICTIKDEKEFGASSLYIVDKEQNIGYRITPSEGRVSNGCWSPDGRYIVFMWRRWSATGLPDGTKLSTDPIRLWVANIRTRELEPIIEGDFSDIELNQALGCHSWTESAKREMLDEHPEHSEKENSV